MRHALLLMRFAPIGAGMSHCVALGAVHDVSLANVLRFVSAVSFRNCDLE